MSEIEYKPTLDAITQTPELADLMTQMIRHVNEPDLSLVEQTVRWQFWTRRIYDLGKRDATPKAEPLRPAPLSPEEQALLYELDDDE